MNGCGRICLPVDGGEVFRLLGSQDLEAWRELSLTIAEEGSIHFVDPEAARMPFRFYFPVPSNQAR